MSCATACARSQSPRASCHRARSGAATSGGPDAATVALNSLECHRAHYRLHDEVLDRRLDGESPRAPASASSGRPPLPRRIGAGRRLTSVIIPRSRCRTPDEPRLLFLLSGGCMRHSILAAALVLSFSAGAVAQQDDESASATMRPVIRGRQAAVTSMKPEATEAARRILQAGGNAFDAAVAGQAALGRHRLPVERRRQRRGDPALRREGEEGRVDQRRAARAEARDDRVVSEEQRRQAAERATVCFQAASPASSTPGICCSITGARCRSSRCCSRRSSSPSRASRSARSWPAAIANTKKIRQYPSTMRVYMPGAPPKPGDIFKNVDLAQHLEEARRVREERRRRRAVTKR